MTPHLWNALDWVLAATLAVSFVSGVLRGFIRTLFGLAGLLAAVAIAAWQYTAAADWLIGRGWITTPELARVVGYLTLAALVMLLFGIAGALVRRTVHAVGLGFVDRLLGAALGAVRGALIGGAIVVTFQSLAPASPLLRSSVLSSYFLAAAHAVSFVVPHRLH